MALLFFKRLIFLHNYTDSTQSTGLTKRALINIIHELEELKVIDVLRDNKIVFNKDKDKFVSNANKYIINLLGEKLYKPENVKSITICDKNCQNCFNACLCRLFDNKKLKTMLTRREYEALIKNTELNNIPCIAG